MGATVCQARGADRELGLVAAVDPHHAGLDVRTVTGADATHLQVAPEADALADARVDVAVDFTVAAAARQNVAWCSGHGVHAVGGTTGLSDDDISDLRRQFPETDDGPNCIVAPNFAIGAVLMMRFSELASPWFETAEIIELHHDNKADAPSGTAMLTAQRMAEASAEWSPDPTKDEVVAGARGGATRDGIHIHSVRLRGMVAHQEVLLGTTGQSLTIRHDSYDRSSFMPGVLLAVKAVAGRPGVTVGLDAVLGI